ncbi:MAG: hypothetical protein JNM95_11810 [Chitinophagaceae bacterium]|nr:hypothetical protein [Chitinophagaceae bacterium]
MMKKVYVITYFLLAAVFSLTAQTSYNPFTQNIHFLPEPTVFGYECGTTQQVEFTMGMTTAANATQFATNPLTVTVCIAGFEYNGANPAAIVSGAYSTNFNWAFAPGSTTCLIGTQNQTLFGTGTDPLNPNLASSGLIKLNLKVPPSSPVGTTLSVNVTLQVPAYMATYNSLPDDPESTQTQTFCNCYALTNPGTISGDQSFCVSGDPISFASNSAPTGGSGGTILYQWQQLINGVWTDIAGANSSTYDAPVLTETTQFRRNAKRSLCGTWLNSNIVTVTINPLPTADAGPDKNLNCTTTSATIGTTGVSGNSYSWAPSTGLSATNIAQPTASPTSTTTYTVVVTNTASGCSATDVVVVNVNTTPPTANAGPAQTTTCTTVSATIGTTSISGNSYSWSPAAGLSATNVAQPVANPASTTTYTVTVTGSNGCTATSTVTVTVNKTPPTVDAGPDKTITCSVTNAQIGTSAIAGNNYSWSPSTGLSASNIAQPIATPSATTTYTVTVTGANGCTATDAVVVTVNTAPPTANAGPNQTTTCTTVSTQIGTAAISGNTYSWLPSAGLNASNVAQPTANPATTTTYTVTVTGSNGCTATSTVTVTVNKTPPTADAGADKTLTCSVTSAVIGTAAISGNTYSWLPATGLSATNIAQPTANPTSTTTYTVTVTAANGCTSTDVVVVNVNTAPPAANAGPNQTTTCLITSVTIGSAAVSGDSYSWLPASGLSSNTIAQPIANPNVTTTYTLTVTGANGCTATSTVTVTVNKSNPIADAGADKNLTCLVPSAIIGTAAISGNTYSWSPALGLNATNIAQPTASPAVTTTYVVTVTGANGCTSTDAVLVNVNTTLPAVDAGADKNLNCTTTSTTIGTVAVSGITYVWSPATGLSATNIAQPVANPSVTTTYTITATGTNGCTATDVVTVNVNTTPPTVNAGTDKNITCSITSVILGTAAIAGNTYSWSPATALSATNIAQPTATPTVTTTYTLTVTGSNGCTATDVVVVNVNTSTPIADAGTDKNLNCTTTSTTLGSAAISGNTYLWNPTTALSSSTAAQPTANPSVTTTYTVIVTGSNGCTASDVVVVNVNTTPPTVDAGPDKNLNCTTTSAQIGTTAIAGNSYSWNPSIGLSSTSIAQPTASPSVTTTYTLTVTGSNGCTATDVVVVNVNTTLPTVDAGVDKNLTCSTTSTTIGSIAISGNTYSWSPATGLSSTSVAQPTASPLVTTTYTLTVTGSNGCTATDVVTVNVNTTPPTVDAGLDKNLNCNTTFATIGTASVVGYTYSWSPSTGLSSTTIAQPVASPTSTTSYTVTVTATNGCTATDVVLVNVNNTPPTVDAGPDKTLTCSVTSTTIGSTTVAGYSYLWTPSTALSSVATAQPTANPTTTTTYTVTVTGTNGCTATDAVTVEVNTTPPGADAGPDKNLNCTTTSTTIGTTAVVGNSYAWSPSTGLTATNIAQPTASPLVTTSYTVTVTGANGCTSTDVVTVNVNTTPPTANAGVDKNMNCSITSVILGVATVSGYTYSWTPATNLSATNIAQPTATPSVTTTYTLVVTGSNGCTASDVVVVNVVTTPPVADAGPDKNLNCNVPVTLIGTAGITGNTYNWSPTTGLSSATVAQPNASPSVTTTYTLTVTGSNGCTSTDVVVVNVDTNPPTADAGPDKLVNCTQSSTTIGTTALVGNAYSWSPSTGLSATNIAQPTASPLTSVTYTVTVTGANGCTATDVVVVNADFSTPVVDAGPDKEVCSSNAVLIGTPSISGVSYSWSPSTGLSATNIAQPTANPSTTTTYTVTATGANGCTSTDVVTVSFKEGTIGNYVWYDLNADGINNEPTTAGMNGVTVQLYSSNDNIVGNLDDQLIQTTVTADNAGNPGYYLFKVCNSGNYYVKFPMAPTALHELTFQTATAATDNNSDASATTGNSPMFSINVNGVSVSKDNMTIDAGYITPLSLGNQVWVDANNNGVKDGAEVGLVNATVKLYLDANNDGSPDGPAVETQTTGANGLYLFVNLIPGNYIVGVIPPPVSGGTYNSSTNNQEANPNLNIDNNDNGVNVVGTEVRTGTITLAAGTEPINENPYNASNLDSNNNLTVDFGFYVCPNPFQFAPIEVCANTTIDLTTLEPAGYTGGVWSQNGTNLTNTNVSNGTYLYTYNIGSCTATGVQTVGIRVPDYAPTIAITPSIVYGVKPVRVVVTINELLGKDACSPLYVFIPRLEPRYTFTWDPNATQLGSGAAGAVQNAQWQYFTVNPNFYIWKYIPNGSIFPASGQSKFGYVGIYDPNNTDGETTFSVQIFQGSGGETNLINNTDSELLIYYRQ